MTSSGPSLAAVNTHTNKPGLGRLFTTPDIREKLNKMRRGEILPQPEQQQARIPEKVTVPRGPRYLTFSGMVIKENGGSMVWLNGKSIEAAKGLIGENYQMPPIVDPWQGIQIVLIDHAQPFVLQPGQTLDAQEKKILASYLIPEQERKTAQRGGDPESTADSKPMPASGQEHTGSVPDKKVSTQASDAGATKTQKLKDDDEAVKLEKLLNQAQELLKSR
ncbi:MAG: hypothetical protein H7839_03785 [Magnetococcus sp. YQC-5]